MAYSGPENLHSRTVVWLKILLPLTALAILSTLFLVSNAPAPQDTIPYADVDVADLLREPRLTDAAYAGMTQDGAALTLRAGEALPGVAGSDNAGLARNLSGLMETPDGVATRLAAGEARLDQEAGQVHLQGGVTLSLSSGYDLRFKEADIGLDQTLIAVRGGVAASGPMGTLTAQTLDIAPAGTEANRYLMVFNGGVRLIYQPPTPAP